MILYALVENPSEEMLKLNLSSKPTKFKGKTILKFRIKKKRTFLGLFRVRDLPKILKRIELLTKKEIQGIIK